MMSMFPNLFPPNTSKAVNSLLFNSSILPTFVDYLQNNRDHLTYLNNLGCDHLYSPQEIESHFPNIGGQDSSQFLDEVGLAELAQLEESQIWSSN